MKKNFFSIIIILFCFSSFSQNFKGGIALGITASQIDGDKNSGYNKLGFNLRTFVKRNFTEKWQGQLEIGFLQKGTKFTEKLDNDGKIENRINLNYLETPILINYIFSEKFDFSFGISPSYLIGFSSEINKVDYTDDLDKLNDFDASALISVNYKLTEKFLLNIRMNYSFLPLKSITPFWFNNCISTCLYYQIN